MERDENLNAIKGKVRRKSKKRGSKVHAKIIQIVTEMMDRQELTTVSNVVIK